MPINYKTITWSVLAIIIFYFLYSVSNILLPFIVGIFVAYALNPAVDYLVRLKISRPMASCLIILSFFVVFGTLLIYALPFLKAELLRLSGLVSLYWKKSFDYINPLVTSLGQYFTVDDLNNFSKAGSNYLSGMLAWVFKFLSNLLTNTLVLANLISLVVLMPLIAYYLLRDWRKILKHLETLLPRAQSNDIVGLAKQINATLGSYVRGQSLVCLVLAFYYSIALCVVGLNFAFTIGIVTGLLSFIPYIGVTIGTAAALGIAFTQFDTGTPIAIVAGIFVIGSLLEGYVLAPKLIGDKVGLHPVWIIFALLAGGTLFGFIGIFLAIPAAAVIGVVIRYFINLYFQSALYKNGKGKGHATGPKS